MANYEDQDKELEEMLRSLPKKIDERPPEAILKRLKEDVRLDSPKRRRKMKWLPSAVAAAALVLLALLASSMLRGHESADTGSLEKAAPQDRMRTMDADRADEESAADSAAESENQEEAASYSINTAMGMPPSHVLLENEATGMYIWPVGLVHEANIVPVTFLIPKEEGDFPGKDPDSVALYNKFASLIPEEEMGFDPYHPYQGQIKAEGDTVVNELPEDQRYDISSASLYAYYNTAKETFKDHAYFLAADSSGNAARLDHVGISRPVATSRKLPYFKYSMPDGRMYLVPYENGEAATCKDAINAMITPQNDIVASLIPKDVDFTVTEDEDHVKVTFNQALDLEGMDPFDASGLVEGLMLTAGSFGKQVVLDNTVQKIFGKYDLSVPLPLPAGANPEYFFRH